MKKFIAAFDGLHFSESTMNYAIFFARNCEAHLCGVFLEDFTRHSYGMADITRFEGSHFEQHVSLLDKRDRKRRRASIARFEEACKNAELDFSVHRNESLALKELVRESVYADLLLISSGESLTRFDESAPTRFVHDILQKTKCPVVVLPHTYQPVEKISLLYKGNASSVLSFRLFSYLFETVRQVETEVLLIKEPENLDDFPEPELFREFIKLHFPNIRFVLLKGYAEEELPGYIEREKKLPLVVLEAYSRGGITHLFQRTMADQLMSLQVPLFIAHQ